METKVIRIELYASMQSVRVGQQVSGQAVWWQLTLFPTDVSSHIYDQTLLPMHQCLEVSGLRCRASARDTRY